MQFLTVSLEYATNITEADCRTLLDYLLTTEEIVSPVATDLWYGQAMADEIASMVFPASHIVHAHIISGYNDDPVSCRIGIALNPPSTTARPLPRFDPIMHKRHGRSLGDHWKTWPSWYVAFYCNVSVYGLIEI